jgi:excisionase family DNA binding protein
MSTTKLLKPQEAADLLNVSRSTIYRWRDDGTLEGIKFAGTVRIKMSAVQAFLKHEYEKAI